MIRAATSFSDLLPGDLFWWLTDPRRVYLLITVKQVPCWHDRRHDGLELLFVVDGQIFDPYHTSASTVPLVSYLRVER